MRRYGKRLLESAFVLFVLGIMMYGSFGSKSVEKVSAEEPKYEEVQDVIIKEELPAISGDIEEETVVEPATEVSVVSTQASEEVKIDPVEYIVETAYDKSIVVENGMEIHYVAGDTWQGLMTLVKDPSRVFVGMPRDVYNGAAGADATTIANRYGAMYAVNGAFFVDENFVGNGGTPVGLVFSNGKNTFATSGGAYNLIGWDNNNQFICTPMTASQAISIGIRDAVSVRTYLVQNGEITNLAGSSVKLMDARTAVGARADGTVLILTVDGRMSHSIGATTRDLAECMLAFGAVGAGNLDGGGSLSLFYTGTPIQGVSSIYAHRRVPNAICVRPEQ